MPHWHLEGDVLDAAWPRPADDQDGRRMTVNNLRAMAGVFAAEGYTRCVYAQTSSVVDFGLVTLAGRRCSPLRRAVDRV